MTDSAARPPDYPDKCELCGTPVRVVGSVTQSYESAYRALLDQAEALAGALEKYESVMPFDSIMCDEGEVIHKEWATETLTAWRKFKGEGGTRE